MSNLISPTQRTYPFPAYPNSWYAMAWSHEIKPGTSKGVSFLGRELVLFRGEDGKARCIDAICPHLGAHMGIKSRVIGNCVECPFHGWRFDGAGKCTLVPYSETIPAKARVGSWPVCEVNGMVLVWHHVDRAEPDFEVPHMAGFGESDWTAPTFHTVTVRTRIQEMNENIFDVAHFVTVHHYLELPTATVAIDGAHVNVELVGTAKLPGRPKVLTTTNNIMHGAGFTTIRVVSKLRFGLLNLPLELMVVVGKTPIDESSVEHSYAITFRRLNSLVGWMLYRLMRRQVIADVLNDAQIWENKRHLVKPLLMKQEGMIMRFRKWHEQFYSRTAMAVPTAVGE